jgi:hypothetical protein
MILIKASNPDDRYRELSGEILENGGCLAENAGWNRWAYDWCGIHLEGKLRDIEHTSKADW